MDSADNLANLRVASFSHYLKPNDQENPVQKLGGIGENPKPSIVHEDTPFSLSTPRIKSSPIKPSYPVISKSMDSQERLQVKHSTAHLNDPQEGFIFKVKGPIMDAKPPLVPPRTRPKHVERLKPTDGEIDIFGADKYFNMNLEYEPRMKAGKKREDQVVVDLDPEIKSSSRQETRSVCSEASTLSSGVALLQSVPKTTPQTKPRRAPGRRFLASIGCTGPCIEKESVYVKENSKSARFQLNTGQMCRPESKTGENFAFPLLNPETPGLTVNLKRLEEQKVEELRKSLEVFGSDTMRKDAIAKNLERKLSMLTWDAIPKSSSLPTARSVASTTACDDMASDASSDLFEIENISASCGGSMVNRPSVDNASGCMTPTTLYAPSEASIEWSVMTASAADFSSAVFDYDPKNVDISGDAVSSNIIKFQSKEPPKSRPSGLLLGCKSQKSVCVAETVHKTKVERY